MLRALLPRPDKLKWLGIVCFALCISAFEVLTASMIAAFAQVISLPEHGQKYLHILGFHQDLSTNRIIFYMAIVLGIIFLIKNILGAGEVFFQNFAIQKMNYRFRDMMLVKYSEIDYGTYLTRNSSFGLQAVRDLVSGVFSQGMLPLSVVLSEGTVFASLIGMAVYMNPSLALIIFAVGVTLGAVIVKWLFPRFYRFGQKLQTATLYGHQHLSQFFHAFKEIVLLGKRDAFIQAYSFFSKKESVTIAAQNAVNALPKVAIELLFVGVFIISILTLCFEHENPTQMIGILGGYLYAGFRLMPGVNRIINQLSIFKMFIPSIEQVYREYFLMSAKENYVDVPDFKFQTNIVVQDLSFRYLNTKRDALSGISLEVKKGESVGIVGETGSGKSTLIDVILGLLRPCEGSVLIDGKHPANSYQWHKKIGYVPQSVYLTDDSIEANIAFGEKEADEDRVNQAVNAAQLRKLIDQLPQGTKTIVGERGVRLSGGERQRISIARALYHQPEVLIFDEATSALDNETEAKLMGTINSVSKDRTVIMIAHRLTTLKNCDKIVSMKDGRVVKIGEYEEA
jgi:ATP-binding cassette subfamily C protein